MKIEKNKLNLFQIKRRNLKRIHDQIEGKEYPQKKAREFLKIDMKNLDREIEKLKGNKIY